jgi:hypothetical protein
MKFNAQALQREMDLAAEELEHAGHLDLAERVDRYNALLLSASKKDLPQIHRGLSRIQAEYEQRMSKTAKQENSSSADATKAQHAVLQARRASIRRKLALKRFLREKAAQRKKASEKVATLRETKSESPMRKQLIEKLADAQKQFTATKNRVDRLKRINERLK